MGWKTAESYPLPESFSDRKIGPPSRRKRWRRGKLDLSRNVRAGDGQRFHRIRPGFSCRDDVGDPKYIVTGEADQVKHADGTFVVKAVNDNISAAYGSETRWFYVDGRFVGPFGISGAAALQDTALVDVIGTFQGGVLVAEEVDITFPGVRQGTADNVWIQDNTAFIVRSVADNVVVIPRPDRVSAYYDNAASPHLAVPFTAIDNHIPVTARGYFDVAGNLEAYWIGIGP